MNDYMAEAERLVKQQTAVTRAADEERKQMAPYYAAERRATGAALEAKANQHLAEAAIAYEEARQWDKTALETEDAETTEGGEADGVHS